MKRSTLLAVGLALLFALLISGRYLRPTDYGTDMDLDTFGQLPVVKDGRVKPMDTVARNALRIISGKKKLLAPLDEPNAIQKLLRRKHESRPAIVWLADAMSLSDQASPALYHETFRIDHPEVLASVELEPTKGFRYPLAKLVVHKPALYERAHGIDARLDRKEKISIFERKSLDLANRVFLFDQLARHQQPLLIPPTGPGTDWRSLMMVGHAGPGDAEAIGIIGDWQKMLMAYGEGRADDFNQAVREYRDKLALLMPREAAKAAWEAKYNRFEPFSQCLFFMVALGLLALAGLLLKKRPLVVAANTLAVWSVVIWVGALVARMYFQDRPWVFVTNLYSSAVFIGCGAVLFALIIESIYRNGLGTLVAAVIGFPTLLIADYLSADGDTMEMMQAVLDTNGWLATHVTTMAIGYVLTFFAGALGAIYLFAGLFSANFDKQNQHELSRMIYGTICGALLFSFVGTVLGGIWADQSWGRFWGWDVKENGALIIVLWNVLILHARWGGLIRQRGIALLAVFGNAITAWSWFGVNMLGVGLHAYANASGAPYLIAFVVGQLLIMGLGLVPQRLWASQRANSAPPPLPKG